MAKYAMNAREMFVFFRDYFERTKATGHYTDSSSSAYAWGEYYNVADDLGAEWLKKVNIYYVRNFASFWGKATSLDMSFSCRAKFHTAGSYKNFAVLWGMNAGVWAYGDACLSLSFSHTSATSLKINFGVGTAMKSSLDELLPGCQMSQASFTAKAAANVDIDGTKEQEITASFDAKTRRLIVTVDGEEEINQVISGSMGDARLPTIEDWQAGYFGMFLDQYVQIRALNLEFPTEGGGEEQEEEWRPLAEVNRMGGDAPLFALLVESEGCEPLCIAQGYRDVWLKDANGTARLFMASGMTISLPERKAGSADALSFAIGDCSGEALARCEELRDSAKPVYVTCLEYASHGGTASDNAPEPSWSLRLFGTSAAITPKGATFSAGWHDTLNAKYPYRRYTAAQFPGLKYVSSSI